MNTRDRLAKLQKARDILKGCSDVGEQERSRGENEGEPNLSDRLQRLSLRAKSKTVSKISDAELAETLGGVCIADGLIAVEDELPLQSTHGEIALHSVHDASFPLLAAGVDVKAGDLIFLDTETTGLSGGTGTLVFLLGLARIENHILRLCQFFLTAFRGENSLLSEAVSWLGTAKCLVTFNGRAFDLPLLTTRYRLSRMKEPFGDLGHVDLLYLTRAAFSGIWPDCRLQTAERRLLKFTRNGDLPGCLIPSVWFDFVRSGIAEQLPAILEHNKHDLVSLAALLPALHLTYSHPHYAEADHVSIARTHLRFGNETEAFKQLDSRKGYLDEKGLLELAAFHRRRAEWADAVAIWKDLARRNVPEAMERLAKYYEHVVHDYRTALSFAGDLLNCDEDSLSFLSRKARLEGKLLAEKKIVKSLNTPFSKNNIIS